MARSRQLATALLALLALTPAVGAEVAGLAWRAIYSGALGGSEVAVDLSVFSDGVAFARLWQTGLPTYLSGHGTMADGSLGLTFYLPRETDALAWEAESVLQDALRSSDLNAEPPYEGYRPAPFGPAIAALSGSATVAWDADFDPIVAVFSFTHEAATELPAPADGDSPTRSQEHELTLERLALFSTSSLTQGRISTRTSFPYFLRGEFAAVNAYLESRQRSAADDFVGFARETLAQGGGGWGLEFDETVFVTGTAERFVSLLGYAYAFTGGAHGNTFADAFVLEVAGTGLKRWQTSELFAAEVDWVAHVGPLVLERLAVQGALWVSEGDVVEVTERDLRVATLEPGGLTFHFDPYHMGPYAQGSFAVRLPYALVAELAAPGGPLEAFARSFGAELAGGRGD